jgi:predicted RNase H-like HicB family nuclease/Arc/MetJ-type ribon-helix-helix transcriptional regulator
MNAKRMKRVNIIVESDLYDRARAVAFIKRESISEVVRKALRDWMEKNFDRRAEIVLSKTDQRRLQKVMESESAGYSRKTKVAKVEKPMKLKVVIHEAEEGGYWAEVPVIPGCATQGETMEELLRNVDEAVKACLSANVKPTSLKKGDRVVEIPV